MPTAAADLVPCIENYVLNTSRLWVMKADRSKPREQSVTGKYVSMARTKI